MSKPRVPGPKEDSKRRPALYPESREAQLIALAVDLAEQQLRDGTASSQVITHYLKLGTEKAKLELEQKRAENKLLEAKTEEIKSHKLNEEIAAEALKAFKTYAGGGDDDEYY